VLGIGENDVDVVEDPHLPDGMGIEWPAAEVASRIASHAEAIAADVLITFDNHGVSGHANHRACYHGLLCLLERQRRSLSTPPGGDNESPTRRRTRRQNRQPLNDETVVAETKPKKRRLPLKAFVLESTNLARKYIGLLDIPLSLAVGEFTYVHTDPWVTLAAMSAHHSQFVWYRKLFIVFSRYVYVNTLHAVTLPVVAEEDDAGKKSR
jgi:N-acetylglucosaminylphosphatidylinositol deacetylase